jgi:hypothetical protein
MENKILRRVSQAWEHSSGTKYLLSALISKFMLSGSLHFSTETGIRRLCYRNSIGSYYRR